MKINYRKSSNKNQLVLSDFNISSFTENYLCKMVTNNKIPGLLPTDLQIVNSLPTFVYDITSKHSLSSYLEDKKMNYSLLTNTLLNIHKLCDQLEIYMLDNIYILLSPEYIFLDLESLEPDFCFCPILEGNLSDKTLLSQLMEFLDYTIGKLDYDDRDCVAMAYTLHQKCTSQSFTLKDLTIYDFSKEKEPTVEAAPITSTPVIPAESVNPTELNHTFPLILGLPPYLTAALAGVLIISIILMTGSIYLYFIARGISRTMFFSMMIAGPVIFFLSIPYFIKKKKYYEFLKEDILPPKESVSKDSEIMPIGNTILIDHQPNKDIPHLVYTGSDFSQDIDLDFFPFTLGKLPDTTNCIISSPLISRLHARFYLKENCYYVEDLNSSNGTFINGVSITPHTMTEIFDGDLLTFAHFTYIFKLA